MTTSKSLTIVPNRELAAAAGRTQIAVSTPATMPTVRIGGPINATLRRWQAEREAKTYRKMADAERAQTDFVNARADLARSLVATSRAVSELRELPLILEHDAQLRQAIRDRELATFQREADEAQYGRDATRDEIAGLRAKQRKKTAAREQALINALAKVKVELEALGRDTGAIDTVMANVTEK
jgi:hypothetical protein